MATNLSKRLEVQGPFGIDPFSPAELIATRELVAAYRADQGFKRVSADLLTNPADNSKLSKSVAPGFSLSLAPARTSVEHNVCAFSTAACRKHCVAFAGNGGYPAVTRGRIWKTKLLADHPAVFVRLLAHELRNKARKGPITMRLNAFSDLRWEFIAPDLFYLDNVTFYDYTKWTPERRVPSFNYHLTYSATENTKVETIREWVADGHNVAVIVPLSRFMSKPDTWEGMVAIDGDKTDDRTTDPKGVIVLLTAKGTLRRAKDRASMRFRHAA